MNSSIKLICGAALGALVALAPGCGPRQDVPAGTTVLAAGHTVDGAAPSDGTVFVTDKGSGQVLYTGRVRKGDAISVDPEKGVVRLNGMTATQRTMRLDHQYEIRFQNQPTG